MAEGHSAAKDAFSWWSNKNSQSLNKWREDLLTGTAERLI